jgi:hypothetical protein
MYQLAKEEDMLHSKIGMGIKGTLIIIWKTLAGIFFTALGVNIMIHK